MYIRQEVRLQQDTHTWMIELSEMYFVERSALPNGDSLSVLWRISTRQDKVRRMTDTLEKKEVKNILDSIDFQEEM